MGLPAREYEPESRTMVWNALHLDATTMKLDETLHEAEPQANSPLAELVIPRRMMHRIEAREERLEKILLFARLDSDPFILDHNAHPVGIACHGLCPDPDGPMIRRELDRIGNQVDQDVQQLGRIGLDLSWLCLDLHLDMLLASLKVG